MKNSHFVTPRAMKDCYFDWSADPIERPEPPVISAKSVGTWIATAVLVIATLVLLAVK